MGIKSVNKNTKATYTTFPMKQNRNMWSLSLSKASISPKQHGPFCCINGQSNNNHKMISRHPCDSSDDGKQGQALHFRQPKDLEKSQESPAFMLYGIRRSTGSLLDDSDDNVSKDTPSRREQRDILLALEIFPNVDRRRIRELLRHDSLGSILVILASESLEATI